MIFFPLAMFYYPSFLPLYLVLSSHTIKVRVKLRNSADLDFDLDPNWGITPNMGTMRRNVAHI